MVKVGYPVDSLAVCSNLRCQDKQDGRVNFVLQGVVQKPHPTNGMRYNVPTLEVKVNCAHCNKEINKEQIPSGTQLFGLPFSVAVYVR